MALPSSGAISLSQIQAEFGGANPISLSEYYGAASGIPTSGAISMSQFYGKSAGPAPLTAGTGVLLTSYNATTTIALAWTTRYSKTFSYGAASTVTFRIRADGYSYNNGRATYAYAQKARWLRAGASVVSVTSPNGAGTRSSVVSANVSISNGQVVALQNARVTDFPGSANLFGDIRSGTNPGTTVFV